MWVEAIHLTQDEVINMARGVPVVRDFARETLQVKIHPPEITQSLLAALALEIGKITRGEGKQQ